MKNNTLRLGAELLESRRLCAADLASDYTLPMASHYLASTVHFHNASKPADVDGDGSVSPIDALRLIDTLNRIGAKDLPSIAASRAASLAEGEQDPIGNVDTNNDGSLNPIDVLVVIDALNASSNFDSSDLPMECAPFGWGQELPQTADFPEDFPKDFFDNNLLMFSGAIFGSSDTSNTDEEFPSETIDQIFDDSGFNIDWVKRTNIDEEMPFMFFEDIAVPTLYSDPSLDPLPVYAMMNHATGFAPEVALFSQNGLFAQVVKKNIAENTSLDTAPVTYFSSNFLRAMR